MSTQTHHVFSEDRTSLQHMIFQNGTDLWNLIKRLMLHV